MITDMNTAYEEVEQYFHEQMEDAIFQNRLLHALAYHRGMTTGEDHYIGGQYDIVKAEACFKRFIDWATLELKELRAGIDEVYDDNYEERRDELYEEYIEDGLDEEQATEQADLQASEYAFEQTLNYVMHWKDENYTGNSEIAFFLKKDAIDKCETFDELKEEIEDYQDTQDYEDSFGSYLEQLPFHLIQYCVFEE